MKKVSLKGKANEILTACALVVICIHVSALNSCYMTNAPDFSQSEARKFFVYIFSIGNNNCNLVLASTGKFFKDNKLHSCYNFALALHEKWTCFQPADVRNFFRYIITRRQRVRFRIKLPTNKHRADKKQKERQMRGL